MVTSTSSSKELKNAADLLQESAQTYRDKNAEYGENFRIFPAVMRAFFPMGLELKTYEDWMRMQFFSLQAVKMTRYAQNFYRGGHADSARDMAVYSAMQESSDAEFNYFRSQQPQPQTNGDKGEPGDAAA